MGRCVCPRLLPALLGLLSRAVRRRPFPSSVSSHGWCSILSHAHTSSASHANVAAPVSVLSSQTRPGESADNTKPVAAAPERHAWLLSSRRSPFMIRAFALDPGQEEERRREAGTRGSAKKVSDSRHRRAGRRSWRRRVGRPKRGPRSRRERDTEGRGRVRQRERERAPSQQRDDRPHTSEASHLAPPLLLLAPGMRSSCVVIVGTDQTCRQEES